jgi:hypothetical protein
LLTFIPSCRPQTQGTNKYRSGKPARTGFRKGKCSGRLCFNSTPLANMWSDKPTFDIGLGTSDDLGIVHGGAQGDLSFEKESAWSVVSIAALRRSLLPARSVISVDSVHQLPHGLLGRPRALAAPGADHEPTHHSPIFIRIHDFGRPPRPWSNQGALSTPSTSSSMCLFPNQSTSKINTFPACVSTNNSVDRGKQKEGGRLDYKSVLSCSHDTLLLQNAHPQRGKKRGGR